MQATAPVGTLQGRTARRGLTQHQIGRFVAAAFGLLALVCFYQPWVAATLPAVGQSVFTGPALARAEAADRVDRASFGSGAAAPAGAAASGAGAAVSSGGLTLPTRVPTVAPGAAASGGLTLPTRIPTVAPGASSGFSGAGATSSGATGSVSGTGAAGAGSSQSSQGGSTSAPEIGRAIVSAEPDRLPQTLLYLVPLAALGAAVFPLIWGRLADATDRRFGKWWIFILGIGGTAGVGSLLFKVLTAPHPNDLLGPGEVQAAGWGLWATFAAFLLNTVCSVYAWTRPASLPRDA